MHLAELTWQEVEAYLTEKQGLIIPIGMCEQHSKHLPLHTDTLIAKYLCKYLSDETGLLVAPTINYGVGLPCDKVFSGSTSLHYEDLRNMLSSIIEWWKHQGFNQFYLVTAHGDPFHLRALHETGLKNVFVLDIYDIDYTGILEKQSKPRHAGEAETSVMLYLFPNKVTLARVEDFETPFEEFKPYLNHQKDEPIPNSPGCQGYPSYATAYKGKRIMEKMKDKALTWIRTFNSN